MKKLMIMCATVAVAAAAQAASINWTISNVYTPGDADSKATKATYTALLFVTANTTDVTTLPVTTLAAVQTVLESGDLTGLSSLAAVSKQNTGDGLWSGATGLTGFSSGTLSAFAVVVDSTDLASANNYFIVSDGAEKSVTFTSASGAKALGWGDQTSYTQGAGKWTSTSVPEPTSGLLMLLGMAGLALRRKHA